MDGRCNTHAIAPGGDDAKLPAAARLWWMLRYLGHEHAAVLDGGWPAWARAGLPTTSETSPVARGRFAAHRRAALVADYDEVRAALNAPDVDLIDSRSPERYRGLVEPIDPGAGTIPGSSNRFSDEVLDA